MMTCSLADVTLPWLWFYLILSLMSLLAILTYRLLIELPLLLLSLYSLSFLDLWGSYLPPLVRPSYTKCEPNSSHEQWNMVLNEIQSEEHSAMDCFMNFLWSFPLLRQPQPRN
ncbi:hypothetical protein HanRHA438_Chr08g0347021 [Helianthus annuus]|nr:hypothetical protein HanRHA438_Chr08g0347021 [Helianthus annuus]